MVVSLKLMDELMAISEARKGLKSVMHYHTNEITLLEMNTDEVLLDLNTPQDYKAAFQKYGQSS